MIDCIRSAMTLRRHLRYVLRNAFKRTFNNLSVANNQSYGHSATKESKWRTYGRGVILLRQGVDERLNGNVVGEAVHPRHGYLHVPPALRALERPSLRRRPRVVILKAEEAERVLAREHLRPHEHLQADGARDHVCHALRHPPERPRLRLEWGRGGAGLHPLAHASRRRHLFLRPKMASMNSITPFLSLKALICKWDS